MNIVRILLYLIQRGFSDIFLYKYAQFFTFLATTLIIFMCGLSLTLVTTVDKELQQVKDELVFHVYWKQSAPLKEVEEQWRSIEKMPYFVKKETFTPEQAYIALEKNIIPSQILPKEKQKTILPPTASLYFSTKEQKNIGEWIAKTRDTLAHLPQVDRVTHSPFKNKFVSAWTHLHRYVILPITTLLFFSLAIIIGNTVALCLHIRKQEVEILHCVGAPTWYIMAPLATVSFLQGFLGAISALVLLYVTIHYFKDILLVPPLMIEVHFPSPIYVLLLVALPPMIALAGTWIAVSRKTV